MFVAIFRRCFRPLALACLHATGEKTLSAIARPLFPLILVAGFGGEALAQATVPGAPVLREVDLGNGQLTVTWRAPENTGSGIDRYKVTADPGTPDSPSDDTTCPTSETGGTATTCTLTGLTNGTAYTVRVVATNSAGDSTPSVSVAATPSIQDAGGRIYVNSQGETAFYRYPKLGSTLTLVVEGRQGDGLPEYLPVKIYIDTQDNVDAVKRFLSTNGGQRVHAYTQRINGKITANLNADITANLIVPLSNQPGVERVEYRPAPIPFQSPADPASPRTPAVAHKAIAWHSAGYDGTGVKVGVIDVGFQNFSTTIDTTLTIQARCYSSSDTTSAVADCETLYDHGTNVTQSLLHIAPKVSLYISNPYEAGELRDAVNWMKDQDVRVINYSVGRLWDGPGDGTSPFPDSPLNVIDTAVVADSIIWVNAAGNIAGKTWYSASPTWTSSSKLAFDSAGDTCNAVSLTQGRGEYFQVRWAGAWRNANTDLALYLLNSAGTTVATINNPQSGGDDHYPNEWGYYIPVSTGSHCLMVAKASSATGPAWVQLQVFSGNFELRLEHHTGHSIGNPAESANAGMLAVGAADYSSRAIESFSSRGPTPDGRTKPDIVGADGYQFPTGSYALRGTSYGSPHVAGLAALVIDRYENDANYDTPAEIATYLKDNARDRGSAGADNTWGHGFAELPALPTATLALSPASISENGGVSTVTATLDRTATTATTITVSATAVSPAVVGDFTLSSATTLTIAANATTSTGVVTITATDNAVRAATKSVKVSGMVTGVVPPAAVTLTITDDDDPVTIPDDSLRAVILVSLRKSAGYTITNADMLGLTLLNAASKDISDLTGLESATNLTYLFFSTNNVTDIAPLSRLTSLTHLDLNGNNIAAIDSLSGLTNLERLYFNGNNIADIAPLSGLANLTGLGLDSNNVTDIAPLSGLTNLTGLGLNGNNIADIAPLSGLDSLENLYLNNTNISDISHLSGLTHLTRLGLDGNNISNLEPLVDNMGLGNEDHVEVRGNPLSATSRTSYIPTLKGKGVTVYFDQLSMARLVKVSGDEQIGTASAALANPFVVKVRSANDTTYAYRNLPVTFSVTTGGGRLSATSDTTDYNGLARTLLTLGATVGMDTVKAFLEGVRGDTLIFTAMQSVTIPDANLRALILDSLGKSAGDTTAITNADMLRLTRLSAGDKDIRNLTGLEYATNLSYLHLNDNNISDISPLSGLTNLTDLYLSRNNNISDISPLSGLTNLIELFIIGNNISDISPLSGLTNLTALRLSRNNIAAIDSLSGLTNLTALTLNTNNISDISPLSGLTNLTELKFHRNNISDISPLSGLTNLIDVWLHGNNISNLKPLVDNMGLRSGDRVDVRSNPLSALSRGTHIPTLTDTSRGVTVAFDSLSVARLVKVSGDEQIGTASTALAHPFVVKVQSANDTTYAYGHLPVTFSVTPGGGSLSATSDTTDYNGLAQTLLTLGATVGMDTVKAFVEGASDTLIFTTRSPRFVTIPDDSLRAVILDSLDKTNTDMIRVSDMLRLTWLNAPNKGISNLAGLEFATQLDTLDLGNNRISNIDSLAGLTRLKKLSLGGNRIADIDSLARLTDLTRLGLSNNRISDLSPLTSNTGLGSGDDVNVRGNPLSAASRTSYIPTLTGRGVRVSFDSLSVASLVKVSGDEQIGTASAVLDSFVVKVRSANDTTYAYRNLPVTFSVAAGGGSLSATSDTTDANGLAWTRLTLGATVGMDTVKAFVEGASDTLIFTTLSPRPVTIPDANLRALILDSLGKSAGDTTAITNADMLRLTQLIASYKGISNLTGLEYATNLTKLNLYFSNVADLSPLSGLTSLRTLHLQNNNISDLSPLSGLTSLTSLGLAGNNITAIDSLSSLTSLQALWLHQNNISDIAPLSGLTSLIGLWLTQNNISAISHLSGLTSLRTLYLDGNNISDISHLSGLTRLITLHLEGNNISAISHLSGLTSLRTLHLGRNNISDLSPLSGLTSLTSLGLASNNISAISHLSGLTSLQALWLIDNNISAISHLSGLTRLRTLHLRDNNISAISHLSGLTSLTRLGLQGNNISAISHLSGLTRLLWLNLASNNISAISDLTNLTQLSEVYLGDNRISDILPLVSNSGLGSGDRVDVRGNPLSAASRTTHIPALKRKGVAMWFDDLSMASLVKFSGDGQTGTARTALKDSFVVKVQSAPTYPYRNLPVTFSVAAGGGSLSAPSDTTDYYGLARTLLTLGTTVGMDTVKAFVEGASDTVIFTTLSPRPVTIADDSLRAVILDSLVNLGKSASDTTITNAEMLRLTRLNAPNKGISDLTGLEYATNLSYLNLGRNNVTDIAPLSGLTSLTRLELQHNNITAIDSLSSLTSLVNLSLTANNISAIDSLSSLTSLVWLGLQHNNISDLSPLSGLTSLRALALEVNNISDLSPLSGLTSLGTLRLSGNNISAISHLSGLTNLTDLGLGENNISDLSPLSGLTNLELLTLYRNNISDISHLSGLTRLGLLSLNRNNISDLAPLSGLTRLGTLSLDGNNISAISHHLSGLTRLVNLSLDGNNISAISHHLSGLTRLGWLSLGENNISDLSPLSGLTRLRWLNLASNNIADISGLTNLTQLSEVYLGDNRISALLPLVSNRGLRSGDRVDVRGNPLSATSRKTHIPTLISRSIRVDFDRLSVASLVKVSGDGQTGTARTALKDSFVVKVQSAPTYPYRNLPVTFSVAAGGGSLSAPSDTTDSNGLARTLLTLGTTVGMDTVKAFVEGVSDTLIFTTLSPQPTPDFDGNGQVNFADFLALANKMGSSRDRGAYEAKYDLDGDGEIGMSDFRILTARFGDGKFDERR